MTMTKRSLAALLLMLAVLAAAVCLPPAVAAEKAGEGKKAAAAEPKAQEPKEKTSKPGHAGTTVEAFKLPSPEMGKDVEVVVVVPGEYAREKDKRYPVLYTLHGRGASCAVFSDMTTVHNALKDKPMLVVGFNADRASWYLDATKKADSQYETFFFNTLLPTIEAQYRTDTAKRAVTGFSMGGFGAFHYMLRRPETFASASSMSGAFEPLAVGWVKKDFVELLGEEKENKAAYEQLDLAARVKARAAKHVKLPPVYIACGTEDGLLPTSQAMRDLAKKLGLTCEYAEAPGAHKFTYWKAASEGVIDFHWRTFQEDYKPVDHSKAAGGEKTDAETKK